MLTEPTLEKLRSLRLDVMAATWQEQQKRPEVAQLSFDERIGLLVEAEWLTRENKRLVTRLKEAKLKFGQACIEDVDYPAKRELDRAVVRQLATCRWVDEHQGIIITGKTGTGKTYVACAFAQQACRKGFRAVYRRASRFFDELAAARLDGTYPRLLARLARLDVLVIDDLGISPVGDRERQALLEVMDDRFGVRSTIITSQIPTTSWHEAFGDPTVADALCERILHNTHRIALQGPTRRKPVGEAVKDD